jgi:spermidine synthase
MCGTWLAGFFLLPAFGLEKTCLLVALSDAVAGAVALWIDLRLGPVEDLHRSAVPPPWLPKQWVVGSLFTVSGAAAMAYEVAWFRLLGLTMGPSVYVFSAILGVFLEWVSAARQLRDGQSGPH